MNTTYTFKTATSVIAVNEYFNSLFNSLVENFPSVQELLSERYDEEELAEMTSEEKEAAVNDFIKSWYSEDTAIIAICDENGNELTDDELEYHHDYFEMIDKLENEFYKKAEEYYFSKNNSSERV